MPDSAAVHCAFAVATSTSVHGLLSASLGCRCFGVEFEPTRLGFRSGTDDALLFASATVGNDKAPNKRASTSERSIIHLPSSVSAESGEKMRFTQAAISRNQSFLKAKARQKLLWPLGELYRPKVPLQNAL
jgi:hypothetical protein